MDSTHELLDGLGLGVVCTDRNGEICLWNRAMTELTGIAPETVKGRSLSLYFPELQAASTSYPNGHNQSPERPRQVHHDRSENERFKSDDFRRGGSIRAKLSLPSRQVHHAPVQGKALPQFDVSVRASPASIVEWQNIWTFHPLQRQLEQAHADFIATVSHELRTPLTSIKGFVDTLLQCQGQLSTDQRDRFLQIVKGQADRLIHMVEDILLVSRLESGQLRNSPQQLTLPESLERVLASLPKPANRDRVQLDILPGLPTVWADPDCLDRILANLLDNALRYSEADSPVTVEVRIHPHDPDRVSIVVADCGIGIAKKQLATIFNRFHVSDNPLTRDRAGTGLGLYITKSLVESLGGSIRIESVLRQGTTCSVDLPSAPGIRWTSSESQVAGGESEGAKSTSGCAGSRL
jgi:two-component system phosphate regulon sensor histidine kinase PhoR